MQRIPSDAIKGQRQAAGGSGPRFEVVFLQRSPFSSVSCLALFRSNSRTMVTRMKPTSLLPGLLLVAVGAPTLRADEGMWTFHNPPVKKLKAEYNFDLEPKWLDHVRLSSVRLNSGGSGSFVSPNGLVLTNHHVASDSVQKLSSQAADLIHNGFHAKTLGEELKCPDLELNVLVAMTDVTAQVKAAVGSEGDPEKAAKAKRAAISKIEGDARQASGLRGDVVTLYRGGEYWLYQYKQYTDVRLVFAPEVEVGFFGGDPDNFTYPRYNLDYALFRVYENGNPAATPNYLKWKVDGLQEGDLVFTSGHPGSTERLRTYSQVEYLRDVARPRSLHILGRLADALNAYGSQGEEQRRQASDPLFGIENSRKAYSGVLSGLRDPELMARKKKAEDDLRAAIAGNPELAKKVGDAFAAIEHIQTENAPFDEQRAYRRVLGTLAEHAIGIVRYVEETAKPNAERLPAFRDSSLDSTRLDLFSPAPIYAGLEEAMLRAGIELAMERLGPDDAFVQAVLHGESAATAAHKLVMGTKLADPAVRKTLVDGGKDAIAKSDDPMIRLATVIDPMLRELIKKNESAQAALADAAGRIAQARFEIYGNSVYPDATFTLRLAYGTVKGYPEDTTLVPWKTTFYGLYERYHAFDGRAPFSLPKRYLEREKALKLDTPLNFVHTCDITGGNSGSPTLDREGNLVGLVFDGNIQSLPNDLIYVNDADRALSVHCASIIESLRVVYGADAIVEELMHGKLAGG